MRLHHRRKLDGGHHLSRNGATRPAQPARSTQNPRQHADNLTTNGVPRSRTDPTDTQSRIDHDPIRRPPQRSRPYDRPFDTSLLGNLRDPNPLDNEQ